MKIYLSIISMHTFLVAKVLQQLPDTDRYWTRNCKMKNDLLANQQSKGKENTNDGEYMNSVIILDADLPLNNFSTQMCGSECDSSLSYRIQICGDDR